jgi:hypothetical protein
MMAAILLLAGCGGGEDSSGEASSSQSSGITVKSPSSSIQIAPAESVMTSFSAENGISFEYPDDWTVEDDGQFVSLHSPVELDCAILMTDVSYEVSLFMAGRGDMEVSIDSLVNKYTDIVTSGSPRENYDYNWQVDDAGEMRATTNFNYVYNDKNYFGFVDVDQVGSRVFLSICLAPDDDRQNDMAEVYSTVSSSFSATNTDGTLEPANLSDLGFPEPPQGFERFYSPVTGQYFIYPSDWNMANNVHDENIVLFNDEGALMLTENWTDTFFANWDSNGNDIEACFDVFLNECAASLETIYGEVPRYHDFEYMATENQELIKATFNYTVSAGTGRCFAELGYREFDGQEYVQATLALYKPGDSYSIDMFSIIMDSIVIYYPTL